MSPARRPEETHSRLAGVPTGTARPCGRAVPGAHVAPARARPSPRTKVEAMSPPGRTQLLIELPAAWKVDH